MELSNIVELAGRIHQAREQQFNEAMTKQFLILPFLHALGYDIFNPSEVVAELTADVGTKRGEKVDYAIMRDGLPVIMIECKPLGVALDPGKCNQLHRYFTTHPSARIGILTDGAKYLFFTDLDQPNIMDAKPFMEIDLSDFNDRYLPELQKLSKDKWDIGGALSSASSLKYVSEVKKIFAEEVVAPSDWLVRHFAARVHEGHVTAKVREQFSTIVRRAIQEYIKDQINSRLELAKVDNSAGPTSEVQELEAQESGEEVVTTEEEMTAFIIVKTIMRQTINPARVTMRDAKSYCAILCDDNNRKPFCRFYFNGKKKSLGIFDAEKKEERVYISSLDDIFLYTDKFNAVAAAYAKPD
ncbi:MAG: type I restriction enzyme HsdR N-terminal domain-containing protein [Proteobacteria bacterium]|nr:type I restriction enzyme HsdR N-terminal domain-containing protein [Pseudomonadota bacterium]MBU1595227.1 type I restriction enzyme HsdR N-terminal domain-containing protein [Pseudomonadota bacterium]